jgi:hypothetical protein
MAIGYNTNEMWHSIFLNTSSYSFTWYAGPGAISTNAIKIMTLRGDGELILTGSITMADAKNIILNTTTGTKIGTATNQKIGFFNATPVVQQTMGVATASAVYTATEQAMLQKVYDVLRTFGFGS